MSKSGPDASVNSAEVLAVLRARSLLAVVALAGLAAAPLPPFATQDVPATVLTDPGDGDTFSNDEAEAAAADRQLLAGSAEGPLRVPVGAPLGGYLRPPVAGEQLGSQTPNHHTDVIEGTDADGVPLVAPPDEARGALSPWTTYMPPSRGYHDALVTKALVLDDGHDIVTIVKADVIGMIDEIAVAVATEVESRTGLEIADGLVMTATHTHDGPGAVANDSVRYFWLAMDVYQPELFDRMVSDVADVVVAALEARVPARVGHATGQESRANSLNSFRRPRDPWTPERVAQQDALRRRIGIIRVDEIDPVTEEAVRPMGIVLNYAAHGIVFDVENFHFSGDALAGAERAIEGAFDEPVTVLFVQGPGGDVSPRADGAPKLQRIDRFGQLLADQALDIWAGVRDFATDADVEAVSQRVALNREALGYEADEYPYEWGAVQCNNDNTKGLCLAAPPPDASDLADNGHAENASFVPLDTRVTAARIGDLAILAQPGEPLVEYGLRLLDASPFGYDDTFVFGYAQDHVGYLLPDSYEDWLIGRVEGTTTFWGWKLGGRLQAVNEALMAALAGTAPPPEDDVEVSYVRRAYVEAVASISPRPGRIVQQPSGIERFGATSFRFEGGDPIVDLPTVTMERLDGEGWVPVQVRGGRTLNLPYEYKLDYELLSGAHVWTVRFEAPKDWPAGTYRFVGTGTAHHLPGIEVEYAAASAPFVVAPSDSLQPILLSTEGTTVRAELSYRPRPGSDWLIDAEVPSNIAAPVREGAMTFTAGGQSLTDDTPTLTTIDGRRVAIYEVTFPSASPGPIGLAGSDRWGNTTPEAS